MSDTFFAPSPVWPPNGIRQIQRTDAVDAGAAPGYAGPLNIAPGQITNALEWLRQNNLARDSGVNVNATPFDLTPYWNKGIINITASIAAATARAPEPALGEAVTKILRNATANDITISTPLGTSSLVLKAGTTRACSFLRVDAVTTVVLAHGILIGDVVAHLAAGPTLSSPILAGTPNITATTIQQHTATYGDFLDIVAESTSTDATVNDLWTATVPDNATTTYDVRVVANQDTSAAGDAWTGTITLRRDGGVVSTVAAADVKRRGSSALVLALDFSGTSVRLRRTGIAAQNYRWTAQISTATCRES